MNSNSNPEPTDFIDGNHAAARHPPPSFPTTHPTSELQSGHTTSASTEDSSFKSNPNDTNTNKKPHSSKQPSRSRESNRINHHHTTHSSSNSTSSHHQHHYPPSDSSKQTTEHLLVKKAVQQAALSESSLQNTNATPSSCAASSSSHNSFQSTTMPPGSSRMPCRARGMPEDHNARTAYFVIPSNACHGDDLICSYSSCRSDGIKFCYCAYCKAPVAKRTFRKRHKHEEGVQVSEEQPCEEADAVVEAEQVRTCPIISIEHRNKGAFEEDRISSLSSSSNPNRSDDSSNRFRPEDGTDSDMKNSSSGSDEHEGQQETRGTKRSWDATNLQSLFETNGEESQGEPKSLRKQRTKQWQSLLFERPSSTDQEALSSWLLKVLSVSNRARFLHANIVPFLQSGMEEEGEEEEEREVDFELPMPVVGSLDRLESCCTERTGSSAESDTSTRPLPSLSSLKKYKRAKNSSSPRSFESKNGERVKKNSKSAHCA